MPMKPLSPSVRKLRRFAKTYRLTIMIIVLIVSVWGFATLAVWNTMNAAIDRSEASMRAKNEKTEEILENLAAEREAEEALEKAEKEKEEKARESTKQEARTKEPPTAVSSSQGSAACNTLSSHSNPAAIDVIVNKKHCLVPLNFVPQDLVTTNGATISAKAAGDFNRMFAAAAADGQPFSVSSSYRSYTTQVSTYNYWVSVNGQKGADTVSARPGYSEHQTGFAIDVGANGCNLECFKTTSQYKWFQNNAARFGFVQRYYAGFEHITGYASEEWHYRYVGKAVAEDMKAKGIKTLEQYWGVEGGDYR